MKTRSHPSRLALVIPCYNEELAIQICIDSVSEVIRQLITENIIHPSSYFILVDDGSADKTWPIIIENSERNSLVKGIKLSRNFGHQNALLAGLEKANGNCDCTISMDADLQHDISLIKKMVIQYQKGSELILAIKNDRNDDFMKKWLSLGFYQMSKFLGAKTIPNHADFRLIGSRALTSLLMYKEYNLFLRGLITEIGFNPYFIYFDVKDRVAGSTKYNMRKMISLALHGITGFSSTPLRLVSGIGLVVLLGSLTISAFILYGYLQGKTLPGWTSTVLPIYFLGGVQMLCLGIIGEYLGKNLLESKARPRFLIEEEVED